MKRGGVSVQLLAASLAVILVGAVDESCANRIRVPEEASLTSAIDMSVAGDTLSLAPGTYERTPDPFIKSIVIEGRTPEDPPVLRNLEAGGVTLRHLHFEPDGPGGSNLVLLRILDSVQIENCLFRGFGSTAVEFRDEGSDHDWILTIRDSRFVDLNVGIHAELFRDGSHLLLTDSLFELSFIGIRLLTPTRNCPAVPDPVPPPLGNEPARIRTSGTDFLNMTEVAIDARNAAWAIDLSSGEINGCPLGIRLERAGARIDQLDLRGVSGSTGIRAISSRLEMTRSRVYQHAVGIEMTNGGECEYPAGVIGGTLAGSCALDTNTLALTTSSPVNADYNWWGTLVCSEAQEFAQGVTLRFLADAARTEVVECQTPVVPATWSRIKARLAP